MSDYYHWYVLAWVAMVLFGAVIAGLLATVVVGP